MGYKELLAFQPMINTNVIAIVTSLQDKSLTKTNFHNKKAYAKRKGDLVSVLEYTIAFEIYNSLKEV